MTTKQDRYISSTDTARMIRETLKIEFPGVKFKCAKTRGGSIRVQWIDGPTYDQVKSVVGFYEGATFDAMQDLKSYKSHQNEGGERIHYCVDYVLCERRYSPALLRRLADWYTPRYAWDNGAPDFDIIEDYEGGLLHARNTVSRFGSEWARDFVMRELMRMSAADVERKITGD